MVDDLTELSEDVLVSELKAREADAGMPAVAVSNERSDLRTFDDASIVKAARQNQKVIYGVDNRLDVFQLPAGSDRDDAECVVALFDRADVVDNGNGTSALRTQNFGAEHNLCAGEPFRDQPVGAFCSGFLVGPDLVATAGHCADAGNVTDNSFVFGYRMRDATTAETVIGNGEIHGGVSIVSGPDT